LRNEIMDWFSSKKIEAGDPEEIYLEPIEARKR
jgi:hypothetical protein